MDNEQTEIFKTFKERVEKLEECSHEANSVFASDTTYFRFLTGMGWDTELAYTQLKDTLEWRTEYRPDKITVSDLAEFLGDVKEPIFYHRGYDNTGHAVLYLHLANTAKITDDEDGKKMYKLICFFMENTWRHCCVQNRYKSTMVIDATSIGLFWMGVLKRFGDVFRQLADHYCESLFLARIVNAGWTLRAMYSLAKSFMRPTTVKKYGCEKYCASLKDVVDDDQLIKEFGGNSDFKYSFAEHLSCYEESLKEVGKESEEIE